MRSLDVAEGMRGKDAQMGEKETKNSRHLPRRLYAGCALHSTCLSLLQGAWPVVLRRPLYRSGLASVRRRITLRAGLIPQQYKSQCPPRHPTSESGRSPGCLSSSRGDFGLNENVCKIPSTGERGERWRALVNRFPDTSQGLVGTLR